MNKNKKTTREIISEMKLMLNDKPKLTLESFIMPESFDDNLGDGIDSFEEEEQINIDDCFKELIEIDKERDALNSELNKYFKELGISCQLGGKE